MKSYDDLQRFKEKTQTNHIEFKDMSEQELNADTTNWAVIKQLLNDDAGSVLGNGQRVDRAAPQPVGPAAFIPPSAHDVPVISQLSVQSFVATTSADSDHVGASLLSDISDSLQPPAPVEVAVPAAVQAAVPADMTPLRATPVAQHTAVSGSSLLAQLAAQPVATPAPPVAQSPSFVPAQAIAEASPAPVTQPVVASPVISSRPLVADDSANVSYKQLFSTAAAPASSALPKDMSLHPLLEKIASCR